MFLYYWLMGLECRVLYMSNKCFCAYLHPHLGFWNLAESIFCFSGWHVFMTLTVLEPPGSLDCRYVIFLPVVFVLSYLFLMNLSILPACMNMHLVCTCLYSSQKTVGDQLLQCAQWFKVQLGDNVKQAHTHTWWMKQGSNRPNCSILTMIDNLNSHPSPSLHLSFACIVLYSLWPQHRIQVNRVEVW